MKVALSDASKIAEARVAGFMLAVFILSALSLLVFPLIYEFSAAVSRNAVRADAVRAGRASWSKIDGFKWRNNSGNQDTEAAEIE